MSRGDDDFGTDVNRRRFLKAAGASSVAALAGCQGKDPDETGSVNETGNQPGSNESETETQNNSTDIENEEPEEKTGDEGETEEPDFEIPLGGLGRYEEKVREASPRQATFNQVDRMLEQSDNPDQLADLLSSNEISVGAVEHNLYELASALYQRQQEKPGENIDDSVVFNVNFIFSSTGQPIVDTYSVEDGELQSNPIIANPESGRVDMRHKPGQEGPDYLKNVRKSDKASTQVPQDYDGEEKFRNIFEEWTEEEKRLRRESTQSHWSYALFGTGKDFDIIPYDAESSNAVFDAMYNDGDTEALVKLNNKVASEFPDTDAVISAEYTGSGWKLREHPERKIGDQLPGEDDFFELTN